MKKRITALALTLFILIGCFSAVSVSAETSGRLLGDTNNDGIVTIIDVTMIQRHLAEIVTFDDESTAAGDVDGNGILDINDATLIQKWIAKMDVPYAIGEVMTEYGAQKQAAVNALSTRLADTKADAGSLPVLIRSYDTYSLYLYNSAYTYDNALAAMAFISEGRTSDAEEILDAFVYVVDHDRYQPGRIRKAYAADTVYYYNDGDSVKLPGWWDYSASLWREDPTQVGSNVGDTSYAALALLQYDRVYNTDKYLPTAKKLMDWVINDCKKSGDGFIAGYEGWPENGGAKTLNYKVLEHNLDAYSAFGRLYEVTGEEKYKSAADSALRFIKSMYNSEKGCFFTGTLDDGVTVNTSVLPLDAQVWNAMALKEEFEPYTAALDTVRSMKTPEGAYPFCKENKNGGFWCEGSAFTALMYKERGEYSEYSDTMDALCAVQLENGLFPAATVDNLSTGIILSNGDPWEYNQDPHIAPTAWFVMAVNGFDPYDFS